MSVTADQFVDQCLSECRDLLDRGIQSGNQETEDRLNHRPIGGEWSPAQVYVHMTLANTPYESIVKTGVKTLPAAPGSTELKHTWFGQKLITLAGPGSGAPAPKAFVPPDGALSFSVVDDWANQFQRIIDLFESCKGKDLNLKFTKNPLIKLFSMNMADCIGLVTKHTQNHVEQIETRIASSC